MTKDTKADYEGLSLSERIEALSVGVQIIAALEGAERTADGGAENGMDYLEEVQRRTDAARDAVINELTRMSNSGELAGLAEVAKMVDCVELASGGAVNV